MESTKTVPLSEKNQLKKRRGTYITVPLSFHLIYFLVLLYHTCTKRHERKSCLFKELLSKWNSNNRNASLYILPKSKSKLKILNLNRLLLSGKNRNYKKSKRHCLVIAFNSISVMFSQLQCFSV